MAAAMVLVLAGCAGTPGSPPTSIPPTDVGCAHVVDAAAVRLPDDTFRFDVTVTSADTGWDKYADAWEIRTPDGEVVGTRILAHPHVDEQPFTRSLSNVAIGSDVAAVTIAARDSVAGFCGDTLRVELP